MVPFTILSLRRMTQICPFHQFRTWNLCRRLLAKYRVVTQLRLHCWWTPCLSNRSVILSADQKQGLCLYQTELVNDRLREHCVCSRCHVVREGTPLYRQTV